MPKIRALGAYEAKYTLCGWAGPEIAKEAFQTVCGGMPVFGSLSPVTDYKGQRQMLWEFTRKVLGKDTENFAQEIGDCFLAGTMVRMADGTEKAIECVKIGDFVMTARGRSRKVVSLVAKDFTGEVVTIRTKGQPRSVTATPDHRMRMVTCGGEELWMPIGELKTTDCVLIPYAVAEEKVVRFDLADGLVGSFEVLDSTIIARQGHNRQRCNRLVTLDEDLGWLIGLYLAEGGSTADGYGRVTRIDFNLGAHEFELIERTLDTICRVFGIKAKITQLPSKPTVTYVRVNNSAIARFFKRIIPGNTYSKRVPSCVMASPKNVRLAVLRGWIDGDGYERVDGNSARAMGVSVSHGLCEDMFHLCASLKLKASVNYRKASKARRSAGVVSLYGESAMEVVPSLRSSIDKQALRQPWGRRGDRCQKGFAHRIKELDRIYVGTVPVYCLEVDEDQSFIANGYAVHNCVSFGGKNVMEYLQCVDIVLNAASAEFHPLFPPYLYGTSRVQVGGGSMWTDGSTGSWLQQAIKQYGVLRRDDPSVPQYAGSVARQWGSQGAPQQFITEGQKHLVKTTAQVNTAADVANSILSGYPVAVCSNQGFAMEAGSDGFHRPRGRWGHCMAIIGFEDHPQYGLYFIILNSWGDVHGCLKDFKTGVDLPAGILRVKGEVVDGMVSQQDSFSYSQFDGFPDNSDKLGKALFDVVGD